MILPPCVNNSERGFVSRGMSIRGGLCQIKGRPERAQKAIVDKRLQDGKYTDLFNFLQRTRIEEADTERLIYAGACDCFERQRNRSRLFWSMRGFFRKSHHMKVPALKPFSTHALLRFEYRMLGFLTRCHPVTQVNTRKKIKTVKIQNIGRYVNSSVTFIGWCITAKTVMTKYGDAMQFVSFEDETGICETVFFPDVYNRYVRLLAMQEAFFITGKVVKEFGALSVEVRRVETL
jgi:DNA polymerase III alpha subunit